MKRVVWLSVLLLVLPISVAAVPVSGTYHSTDLGGSLYTGRASNWRTGVNSGLPHVLHIQSWDGNTLGSQWEIHCAVENSASTVQDNRVNGEGTVVYTEVFQGGTFTLFPGGWPWGDGTGTLGTTTLISTVQYLMINGVSTPVASVVNGNTSGTFTDGCLLTFTIGNGSGVGETTSLDPSITIPPDYPVFLDDTCNPTPSGQQFGTWGDVATITAQIDCSVPTQIKSWSAIKANYE